jgi:preprotein translocase subunit SecA
MAARRAAYACDITYCTAKELVFDYLRDGLAGPRLSPLEQSAAALTALAEPARRQPLLRELDMAIIDEADSILIDEARVPLVLSRAGPDAAHERLRAAWVLAGALEHGTDFVTDEMARGAHLTACGRAKLEAADTARDLWLTRSHREETVVLALTARHLLHEGRDYVVHDGRVAIVDATTGRKALGRAWSQGLQQLVELKAGCALSPLLSTVAQITYQRFFPRYRTLAGMSGTLREARRELACVYRVRVSRVPLRVPGRRVAHVPRVFADTDAMWRAAAEFAAQARREGRPLLIGTDSVAASEALSRRLAAHGLAHDVLNALQDRHEAEVIARAGRAGAITVATNMAGRGTDIVLDDAARAAGGLHVLCCQQNSERRIDRQLMGRCARQGDPGSHAQWLALDGAMLASAPLSTVIEKVFKNKNLRYYLGWVCKLRLQFAQRLAERRARRERAALLRRDERLSEALAFGGSED